MNTTPKKRKPRGYIILEAMAGAAILGVSMVSVYHHLGFADRQMAEQLRRAQADSMLQGGYAMWRKTTPNPAAQTYSDSIGSGFTTITRDISVSGLTANEPRDITVTVTFRNVQNKVQKMQTKGKLPFAN